MEKEPYHGKTPHIIFITYIKIQNIYKESSQPESAMQTTWKFPPNHKIQPGSHYRISCTAAITGGFVSKSTFTKV